MSQSNTMLQAGMRDDNMANIGLVNDKVLCIAADEECDFFGNNNIII